MHRLFLNILFECNLTPDTDTYRSPCVLLYILCLSDFLSVHQGLKVLFVSTRLLHVREGKKKRKLTFQLMIFPPFERLESNSLWTAPTQAQLFHCSRCPFSNCAHKGKMPRLLFFFFFVSIQRVPTSVSWSGAKSRVWNIRSVKWPDIGIFPKSERVPRSTCGSLNDVKWT